MPPLTAGRPLRRSRVQSLVVIVLVNVVLGVPAYFTSFLFAYGFQDRVGPGNHLAFLLLITCFAVVTGLVGMAVSPTGEARPSALRRARWGVLVSLALNAAAVGAGSIVSAQHKAENSVSAGFSTPTDLLVASGLLALALGLAVAAVRVDAGDVRQPGVGRAWGA